MSDRKTYRIKPLDDKSDYTLLQIRVLGAKSAKGLYKVFETKTDGDKSSNSKGTSYNATNEQCKQASNIIISALAKMHLAL